MLLKRCLIIIFFSLALLNGFSQEHIVPLMDNPVLTNYSAPVSRLKSVAVLDTVSLPFFDDFSGSLSPFPKSELWLDSFVFINDSYPSDPMSVGVATFDALNQYGKIYDTASTVSVFVADALTSKPIRLKYTVESNVFLSFYYQAQGLGDSTEIQDSLMVDFYNPASKMWWNVWKIKGNKLHPFKSAIIPINADTFLVDGFQFRFRNKASISDNSFDKGKIGNVDHWNVDYVKLDINRNPTDTIMEDVAISRPLKSLLKESATGVYLTSMPWKQFQIAFEKVMRSDINICYKNNSSQGRFIRRHFYVRDLSGTSTTSIIDPGGENIIPQQEIDFKTNLEYPFFTDETDSAFFEVKGVLEFDPSYIKINDTTRYIQRFSNYFSYDDGSPEYGYGLSGQGTANGMVACKFTSYYADSLTAIRIFFNSTLNNVNQGYPFHLAVWKATPNGPGEQIYLSGTELPRDLGKFVQYKLDSAIIVDGDFFVGWKQPNEDFLNVGLDRNYSATGKLFYNVGSWKESSYDHSALMIRPVFGTRGLISKTPKNKIEENNFKVYPNPTSGNVNIEYPESVKGKLVAIITNMTGKTVYEEDVTSGSINLSDLPTSLYFLVIVEDGKKPVYKGKILVQH